MAHLTLSLLGSFQITLAGRPVTGFESIKERALLAYLAVQSDHAQQREMLAELLWPDRPQGTARADLRHTLAHLRRTIGDLCAQPPYLLCTRATLQFNSASDASTDIITFTETLRRTPLPSPDELEAALALRRGPFLDDLVVTDSAEFEEWRIVIAEQIDRLAAQACAHSSRRLQGARRPRMRLVGLSNVWRWNRGMRKPFSNSSCNWR
ncbi:MAG: winged helix-turn-helix domain-containing protein [Caldilineaceae bacterium]|nr:winged helix-turn-helix domain-containing protein [Caldilineaceae bacterium]